MKVKRTFFIGDEWLYFKIYCGPKTADTILTEVIKPISEKLIKQKQIDQWFFIRYADPKNHLRLRFHLLKKDSIVVITKLLNKALTHYVEADLVWKVTTDTYQREMERYGTKTIELAERIFYNDSILAVGVISLIEGDEGEIIRWRIALRSIDELLNDFGYTLEEKFQLLRLMKHDFAREFHMDKHLKIQLGKKYRKEANVISQFLNPKNDENSEFNPIFDLIKVRSEMNQVVIHNIRNLYKNKQLEKELNEIMWSFLHMLNNRLFKSKQRLHELVMYYYLHQFYRSKLARMGIKVKELE
ncbi:thiopeptide-type bacteriocin biosynthesis protein [Bacteroidota bacterium]